MFTKLGNIVSGRTYHWNINHMPVLREIFESTEQLEFPLCDLFKNFSVAANVVLEELVRPENSKFNKSLTLNVDLKKIEREDFKIFYALILSAYSAIYVYSNPKFGKSILESLHDVIRDQPYCENFFNDCLTNLKINEGPDKLGFFVWDRIVMDCGIGRQDFKQATFFTLTMMSVYIKALQDVIK